MTQLNDKENFPSPELMQKLADRVRPGSVLKSISPVEGSNSHKSHIIEAIDSNGETARLVLKRYAKFRADQRSEKARREFMALKFVSSRGIRVPKPILLDESGTILGSPGIVTSHENGRPEFSPQNPERWASQMAETLAKIHSIETDSEDIKFALDANKEAAWFLSDNNIPEFMRNFQRGREVWNAIQKLRPKIQDKSPVFVHLDYWPGNVLWNDEKIIAVVDWEDAGFGDPAIDVAYARMEISTMGYFSAADTFLSVYESITGKRLVNLLFWELAAIIRPMSNPAIWFILESPRREQFSKYIDDVLKRMNGF